MIPQPKPMDYAEASASVKRVIAAALIEGEKRHGVSGAYPYTVGLLEAKLTWVLAGYEWSEQ